MTYTLIVAEPESGRFGAAVASRFLAVGAYCLYLRGGVGAVVTQGIANPVLGLGVLEGLAAGHEPDAAMERLLQRDPHHAHRQTLSITPRGAVGVRTGSQCGAWAGHDAQDGLCAAGNLLVGPAVLRAMIAAYRDSEAPEMAGRLLDALEAGRAEGGDRRGEQAAAIRVFGEECYAEVDLRVDDDPAPLSVLRRLLHRHHGADVQQVRAVMPRGTLLPQGPTYPELGDLSATRAPEGMPPNREDSDGR